MSQHHCCVVLVIAHRDAAYARFRELWWAHWRRTGAPGSPPMALFFLYNDPDQREPVVVDGPDLTFSYAETYPAPGLLMKTLGALDWLAAQGVTYDWCLRTNLSSGFDWTALRRFLRRLRCRSGVVGMFYQPQFVSGAAMLLSADVVRGVVGTRRAPPCPPRRCVPSASGWTPGRPTTTRSICGCTRTTRRCPWSRCTG